MHSDDAELAVSNAQGGGDYYKNVASRYEQLLMRRLRDAGQHKRAIAIITKQVARLLIREKGKLFALNYVLALGYLRNGDVNTADILCRTQSRTADGSAAVAGIPDATE